MVRDSRLVLALLALGAATPAAAQGFGSTAALGAGEIFLSESQNPYSSGTVFVFRPDAGGRWIQAARFSAADSATMDRFGRSLSFANGRLLVGATSVDDSRGAAYVFEKNASGAWTQSAKLVPSDAVAGESHGRLVHLDGDRAFVAGWGRQDGRGGVSVWQRGANGWTQQAMITSSDVRPGDFFGTAIAVAGDRAIISATQRDTATGVAYAFRRQANGTWQEEAILRASTPASRSGFGAAIVLLGDEALISAPGFERGVGAVYLFRRGADGRWTETGMVRAPEDAGRGQFGATLAVSGNEVWVGAPFAEGRRGRIYRLAKASADWAIVGSMAPESRDAGDTFGGTIAVGGNVAVVGLPNDDNGLGSAMILARTGDSWTPSPKLMIEAIGLEAMTGKKADCAEGKVGVFGCNGMDLLAFLPIKAIGGERGVQLNDIWGWTDPQNGREYAIVGRIDGTSFVDVTDPVAPRYLGDLPKTAESPSSSWRDIKVYKDHAYIVADGAQNHGMQVFDLTRLRQVGAQPATFTPDYHYDRVASAHNIVIDTTSGYAFAVGVNGGGETCGGALHMIDIREPKAPKFAGCFADPATGRQRTGYTHDAQCVNYRGPDRDYQGREICFNSSETAIGIADVTDKANPKPISNAAYPNVAYTHQGWLTEDQRYFFVNDEGDETAGTVSGTRTLIWDLQDLDDPVLLREYVSDVPAIDHNLYIKDNLMYQANYTSGLRVFDVSDPANPVPVGFFDTMPIGPDSPTFNGAWSNYPFFKSGTIIVSSIGEGLFLLKKSEKPLTP